jgi:hypothetical protein
MIPGNASILTIIVPLRNETHIGIRLYVGLFIFVENLSTFLILIRCKNILSQIRVLTSSLCLTDMLCGILYSVPGHVIETYLNCHIKKQLMMFLIMLSILIVSTLNADRFLALYFGIQYYTRVTKRKFNVAISLMPVI